MRAGLRALLLGSSLASCARPAPLPASLASSAETTTTGASAAAGRVGVEVRAPSRLRYSPAVLGAPRAPVEVVVTNRTSEDLDVTGLRLRFAAVREGVSFGCHPDGVASFSAREPRSLAPGATFTYQRWLDCELPLTGIYELRPAVTFGRAVAAISVAPLRVRVVAPRTSDPEPIDDRGLFIAIGTSKFVASRPGRGNASAEVAVVNGSTRGLSTPRIRLLTRVRINGYPLTCESDSVAVDVPPVLASGAVYRERVDVPCVGLEHPGVYGIEVRALLDETREVLFGTLRVEITRDRSTLDVQQQL